MAGLQYQQGIIGGARYREVIEAHGPLDIRVVRIVQDQQQRIATAIHWTILGEVQRLGPCRDHRDREEDPSVHQHVGRALGASVQGGLYTEVGTRILEGIHQKAGVRGSRDRCVVLVPLVAVVDLRGQHRLLIRTQDQVRRQHGRIERVLRLRLEKGEQKSKQEQGRQRDVFAHVGGVMPTGRFVPD